MRYVSGTLFLLPLLPLCTAEQVVPSAVAPKQIFVLNSYRSGYEWTDDVVRGIARQMRDSPFETQLWVEYLDARRNRSAAEDFLALYHRRYASQHFDLVITTDDEALHLVVDHPEIFAGVPVVFGGVSDTQFLSVLPRHRFTGVEEVFSELAMLDMVLTLHPRARDVYLICDPTPLSIVFRENFQKRAAKVTKWSLHLLEGQELSLAQLTERLRGLKSGDVVFIASFQQDATGIALVQGVTYAEIAAASPVPVYAFANVAGRGVVAGMANTGINHGSHVGRMAKEVLSGVKPSTIPYFRDDENIFQFDARQMARFGISESRLPSSSQVLFKQESPLARYWNWIVLVLIFGALQTAIIVGFIVNFLNRRRAEEALSSSNAKLAEQNHRLEDALKSAEAAAEAKRRFLSNMSHEIRTPMHAILGMADLLRDTPLQQQQREYADTIGNSARSLLEILNDILEISRIEAGQLKIEHEPFAIAGMLKDLAAALGPSVPEDVSLQWRADPALPELVSSDPHRIRQVLLNLLSNALKFTTRGLVVVRALAEPSNFCRFEVEDTGIGIRPEHIERIFDRFYQVDDSNTRNFEGSGLGLAICREIIKAMGGEVGVRSEFGSGSTFWFRIPVPPAEPQASRTVPEPPAGLKVLVVEDNLVNLRLAQRFLEKLRCRVHTATGGYAGLSAMDHGPFDLILMDVQMPDIDGIEVTRQIRDREGDQRHTPIVALTAGASEEDRNRCLQAGMDDHVSKPFSREALADLLCRYGPRPDPA